MSQDQRLALLRGAPHFATLPDHLLREVLGVVDVRTYDAGEILFLEGDEHASLHIVESGTIRIYKMSPGGREQVLRLMRAGDTFADVPAFDNGPYPANADAVERSTVLFVPRPQLHTLMHEHPEIAIGALNAMAGRLRHLTELVEDLSLRRVVGRVARLLLRYQGSANLSQSQMATMVGTAREMVNRSLNSLADQGVIELHGQEIVIKDPDRLAQIVEGG